MVCLNNTKQLYVHPFYKTLLVIRATNAPLHTLRLKYYNIGIIIIFIIIILIVVIMLIVILLAILMLLYIKVINIIIKLCCVRIIVVANVVLQKGAISHMENMISDKGYIILSLYYYLINYLIIYLIFRNT